MTSIKSFLPITSPSAQLLILGSMPGIASLEAQQYYAHPRNAFWPIMEALFGVNADKPYEQRVAELIKRDVAVWDVLQSCVREGSLDNAIETGSRVPNDFAGFLADHPQIHTISFNGTEAENSFRRYVLPNLDAPHIRLVKLPSTSPAHAIKLDEKIRLWKKLLD